MNGLIKCYYDIMVFGLEAIYVTVANNLCDIIYNKRFLK